MTQRKSATTTKKASLSTEAGGATWNTIITQEGGKDETGHTSHPSARERVPTDPPSFLPALSPQPPGDHSHCSKHYVRAFTLLMFIFHHKNKNCALEKI